MRLIDADNLVDELEELSDSYVDNNCSDFTRSTYNACRRQGVDAAIEVVKEQTRIDTVKHGHWIIKGNGNADCSCCGYRSSRVYDDDNADRYCRHCGARMDGDNSETN